MATKKKSRRRKKKNPSTGAWIAITAGIVIGVPTLVAAGLIIYTVSKTSKAVEQIRTDPRLGQILDEIARDPNARVQVDYQWS